ncbi:MAG: DMT family transporter [Deltaproteobacteria bacterium]|nr:DMT family transporter [Deltaproteobacteria bacterium]
MRSSRETRAFVLLTLVTLVWAGLLPTGKVALRSVPPLTIAAIRMTIGSLLLRIYLRRDPFGKVAWSPRLVGSVLFLGFTGYFVSTGGSYYGLRQTTVTNAALLSTASPAVIALLAAAFLQERLPARTLLGIGLSVLGVGIIVTRGSWAVITESQYNPGDLLLLGTMLSWGIYTIYGRQLMQRISPLAATTYTYMAGAFFLVVASGLIEWEKWTLADTTLSSWLAIAYQTTLGTFAHFWFYDAVATIGPSRASVFLNLVPVMAIALAYVFLHEPLTVPHLVGGAIVIGGIIVATRR